MTIKSGVDWEFLAGDNKKRKTREHLLHLTRRDRLGDLVDLGKRS